MSRRKRTDTLSAQVEMIRAASEDIKPPEHIKLRKCDMPHWNNIISARAKIDWVESDLEVAGELARVRADIERVRADLEEEGDVLEGKLNPKRGLLKDLISQNINLSRAVHVHSSATLGRPRDTGKRAKSERELMASLPEDDLLAQPVKQVQ